MERIALIEFQGYIKGIEKPAETLPHMWKKFGTEMVSHLDGLFCFVLNNKDTGETFAVRDRFGSRTLYYADSADRGLVCGNSIIDVIKLESIADKRSVELCVNEKGWNKRWRAYALLVWYHLFFK